MQILNYKMKKAAPPLLPSPLDGKGGGDSGLRTPNSELCRERRSAFPTNSTFQRGFTLIEIIVVIVILCIVSGITIKFLVDSMRIYTMTVNQKTLFDEGKLALERMCRDIRDAQGITTPTPGNSGNLITFTRTNGTGSTATDPVLDHAGEVITFQWDGTSGHPLEKVKQYPTNPTTVPLAENVTAFTVTCGVAGTFDSNQNITLVLTLSRTSGENVTLQTMVYPKNLSEDLGVPPTYNNFRIQDSSGNYASWQEVLSP
jgi:prepilin-type N-terminal cleavage/methylation domain-containing protein